MAQSFKETAHLNNDPKKLADGWTHVFDRKNCECEECEEARKEKDEAKRIHDDE